MPAWFTALIGDTSFWVMVSTLLCFGFIGWKAAKPIKGGLDGRAAQIAARLAEAEALRLEAQNILEEYKLKSQNALNEAESVLENAKARAEHLRTQLEKELKDSIARQEQNAKTRIARMEEEAINAIKSKIIATTITNVKAHANDQQLIAPSIDSSLDDIKKILTK